MLKLPCLFSGAKISVRRKRANTDSSGSARGLRRAVLDTYAGPEFGGAAFRAMDVTKIVFVVPRQICLEFYNLFSM